MYGGYQGNYTGYGNQQYASTTQPNAYQQSQQQNQNYYTGVNPYANYGTYGAASAALPPPPPPPVLPDDYVHPSYRTFPAQPTKLSAPAKFYNKPVQQQNAGYNGSSYDAAIYNYAQSGRQNPWNKGKPGMSRKFGGQGTGDSKQYYCDVCKVSCAGNITYKEHLEGQRHKKKELLAKQGTPSTSLAKNKLSYRCDLCDVTCTGQDTYAAHVRGNKHVKTVALHRKLGKPVPEDVPTIIAPGEDGPTETKAKPKWHQQALPGGKRVIGINTVNFIGGTKLSSTGQIEEKKKEVAAAVGSVGKPTIDVEDEKLKAMIAAEDVKPVGEEHVSEERDATGKLIQYHCKLCDCKFSDPNAKDIHLKGRRHRLSYRQKVDPTLVVDPKPSTKKAAEKKKITEQTLIGNPVLNRGPWFSQPTNEGTEFNIIDERTLEEKYKSLYPGKEFCDNVEKIIFEVSSSLKIVSEKIERSVLGLADDAPLPEDPQKPRTILGVARVGTIAKNTFIKGERFAELVVSCTPVPTVALVQQVKEIFESTTTEMNIETDVSPSCLIVSASYFPELQCRLLLTSTAVRNTEEEFECADKPMCLLALSYIRNTKWYDSHCQYLNSCQQVIRLFRDARSRYTIWSAIDDYMLELLVANIIDSSATVLNVSEAFKRVLEAISSGYLHSAILTDPCETTKPNVLDSLTEEQKHTLTYYSQNMLRQVAFNQIHEVLGIERVSSVPEETTSNLKRSHTSNGNGDCHVDDEPETKKECPEVVNTMSEEMPAELAADQVVEPSVNEEDPTPAVTEEDVVTVEPMVSV